MCKNTFIKTEAEFETLVETLRDIHNEWTEEEVLKSAVAYANYFNSPRSVRTAHIDLTTPCQFHTRKDHEIASNGMQKIKAKENLEKHVGMAKPYGSKWHVAHLCENSSSAHHVCCNPLHIYFATPKENHYDIDRLGNKTGVFKTVEKNKRDKKGAYFNPTLRKKAQSLGGKKGGKAQLRAGTHNTLIRNKQCRCCYKKFTALNIKQHEKACAKNLNIVFPEYAESANHQSSDQ